MSSKLDGADPTESDRSERLYAIFHAFRTSFQVVTIDLEGTDDPQMIFETLNDRGEPLLASDLIRNWIFMMAERRGSDLNALYSEYWNHYETRRVEANDDNSDLFWHKNEGRGRDSRSRIDRLIFYDLMIRKTRKSMNAEISQHTIGHLFRDFRAFMEESLDVKHGHALQSYLGELQVRSDHYASLVHPEGYELEPSFARRLKAPRCRDALSGPLVPQGTRSTARSAGPLEGCRLLPRVISGSAHCMWIGPEGIWGPFRQITRRVA